MIFILGLFSHPCGSLFLSTQGATARVKAPHDTKTYCYRVYEVHFPQTSFGFRGIVFSCSDRPGLHCAHRTVLATMSVIAKQQSFLLYAVLQLWPTPDIQPRSIFCNLPRRVSSVVVKSAFCHHTQPRSLNDSCELHSRRFVSGSTCLIVVCLVCFFRWLRSEATLLNFGLRNKKCSVGLGMRKVCANVCSSASIPNSSTRACGGTQSIARTFVKKNKFRYARLTFCSDMCSRAFHFVYYSGGPYFSEA